MCLLFPFLYPHFLRPFLFAPFLPPTPTQTNFIAELDHSKQRFFGHFCEQISIKAFFDVKPTLEDLREKADGGCDVISSLVTALLLTCTPDSYGI